MPFVTLTTHEITFETQMQACACTLTVVQISQAKFWQPAACASKISKINKFMDAQSV